MSERESGYRGTESEGTGIVSAMKKRRRRRKESRDPISVSDQNLGDEGSKTYRKKRRHGIKEKKKMKREGSPKVKEEIVVSPYFKEKCMGVNPIPTGEGGQARKPKSRRKAVDSNWAEEQRNASKVVPTGDGNKYFMKKCLISQLHDYSQTEPAKIDAENSQNRKKKRRKDGNGNNRSDEYDCGGACKVEKVSIDDILARFVYTGGKSHNIPAIHQSLSNKTEINGGRGKTEIVKEDDLVGDNAPLFTADAVGRRTAASQHISCKNVKRGNMGNVEVAARKKTTGVGEKVIVVSPYFANADTQVKLMTKQVKTESKKLNVRKVSPYFCSTGQEEESSRRVALSGSANSKTERSKARTPILTAAQKRDEAYLRKTPDIIWSPPRSPFNLLQEDHAFDPWRVLVICMLLNQTTGLQVSNTSLGKIYVICLL